MINNKQNVKIYNKIFIGVSIGALIIFILGGSFIYLKIRQSLDLLTTSDGSEITIGAYEAYQTGDPLITKVPTAEDFDAVQSPAPIIKQTDQILGRTTAKISLIQFTDFSCQYCAEIQPLLKKIIKQYPGQVKIVFKDSPNEGLYPQTTLKHQAAYCAGEQGKFWSYADLLWNRVKQTLDEKQLNSLAKELALDQKKFSDCLAKGETLKWIRLNNIEGQILKISSTPYFFLNEAALGSSLNETELTKKIKQLLAQ